MFRVLVVGPLEQFKNVEAGIKAVQRLNDVKLTVAGDGPERKKLEAMTNQNVEFVGFVGEQGLSKLYSECDVVLFPVLFEPFGLVPVEAMHSGKPVICSKKAGVAEIVQEAKCGFLVNPKDPEEIAEKIRILQTNAKLREDMGKNGKRYAQRRLTGQSLTERFERILHSLLSSQK